MALESCNTYTKRDEEWQRGRNWMGGTTWLPDGAPNQKFIRALDIQTGRTVWSYAQSGEARTFSGVLSTDGDVVFFGENSGAFAALDARSGEPVWHRQINQEWRASPMTYIVGGATVRRDRVQARVLGVRAALTTAALVSLAAAYTQTGSAVLRWSEWAG